MATLLGPGDLIPNFPWGLHFRLPFPLANAGQGQFADGRCILFGGNNTSMDLTFANTLVSVNNTFVIAADASSLTAAGALPTAFAFGISTLLGDGRLLAVGQEAGSSLVQTIDPGSLLWTAQPPMAFPFSGCALTTLANGNGLRIGGENSGPSQTVDEYLQGSDTWVARAPTLSAHVYSLNATTLPNSEVLLTSYANPPEAYDPGTDTWYPTANLPQAGNTCQTHVLLPNGKLFTCASASGFTLTADLYDPVDRTFSPLPSHVSTHSQGIFGNNIKAGYVMGDGLVSVMNLNISPRSAFYDHRRNKWYGGGFDQFPPSYNEPLGLQNFFYLGQYGFLTFGNYQDFSPIPHRPGYYGQLSTRVRDDGHVPTFGGITSIVQGTSENSVFIKWAPASDAVTAVDDINYYVYYTVSPFSVDLTPGTETRNTEIWAGSLSREITGLSSGVTYRFTVRARNLRTHREPGNYSTNTGFTPFTTIPVAVPTFSWVATTPMSEARMGLYGATRTDGRFHVFGGLVSFSTVSNGGDIYAQTGLSCQPSDFGPATAMGAALNASPEFSGGHHRPTAIGGTYNLFDPLKSVFKNYPYTDNWYNNDGATDNNSSAGDTNIATTDHTAVALPFGDILKMGGTTSVSNSNTGVPTVERMFFRPRQVDYVNQTLPFTVGDTLTGGFTGAQSKIVADTGFNRYLIRLIPGTDFAIGEVVTGQTSGATGTVVSIGPFNLSMYLTGVGTPFVPDEPVVGDIAGTATIITDNFYLHSTSGPLGTLTLVSLSESIFQNDEPLTGVMGGDGNVANHPASFGINQPPDIPHSMQSWEIVEPMNSARSQHSSIVLDDGKILTVGGFNELGTALLNAEIYDPELDTWTLVYVGNAHYQFPMVRLLDGRVLCIGGGNDKCDIFNTGPFGPPAAHTDNVNSVFHFSLDEGAGSCADSVGTVAGLVLNNYGATSVVGQVGNARSFLANDTMDADGGFTGFSLSTFTFGMVFKSNGLVASTENIVDFSNVGPTTINLSLSNFALGELDIVLADGIDSATFASSGAGLVDNVSYHLLVTRNAGVVKLYVNGQEVFLSLQFGTIPTGLVDVDYIYIGDGGPNGSVIDDFWMDSVEYTAGQALTEYLQLFPSPFTPAANLDAAKQEHTANTFGDGKVGVFGGRVSGLAVNEVRLYDPNLDSWSSKPPMLDARCRHVSFLLPNNKVLVVGGEDASGNALATAELSS